MKNEVTIIKKELSPLIEKAKSLEIKDEASLSTATEVLSKLNSISDRIDEEKAKVLDPLNAARKAEMARWKPLEVIYDEAIDAVRLGMSLYQTKVVNDRKQAEEAIAARIGSGKGKIKLETAVSKIEELDTPTEKVSTESGSIKFRDVQKLKIISRAMIPVQYWIVDEEMVLQALKEGHIVPGAHIEIIQVPVNYR